MRVVIQRKSCINFVIILQVVYAHLLVNIYTISPFICII